LGAHFFVKLAQKGRETMRHLAKGQNPFGDFPPAFLAKKNPGPGAQGFSSYFTITNFKTNSLVKLPTKVLLETSSSAYY
jgi:hypothetical protein